jgi:hypothetical protein
MRQDTRDMEMPQPHCGNMRKRRGESRPESMSFKAAKAASAPEPQNLMRYGRYRDLTELVIAQPRPTEVEVLKPLDQPEDVDSGCQAFVASNPWETR